MGCTCCADTLVYDLDESSQKLSIVAIIKGTYVITEFCNLVGASSVHEMKYETQKTKGRTSNILKYGREIYGVISPPLAVLRKIDNKKRIKCEYCHGTFNDENLLNVHYTFCLLQLSGKGVLKVKKVNVTTK